MVPILPPLNSDMTKRLDSPVEALFFLDYA